MKMPIETAKELLKFHAKDTAIFRHYPNFGSEIIVAKNPAFYATYAGPHCEWYRVDTCENLLATLDFSKYKPNVIVKNN